MKIEIQLSGFGVRLSGGVLIQNVRKSGNCQTSKALLPRRR